MFLDIIFGVPTGLCIFKLIESFFGSFKWIDSDISPEITVIGKLDEIIKQISYLSEDIVSLEKSVNLAVDLLGDIDHKLKDKSKESY